MICKTSKKLKASMICKTSKKLKASKKCKPSGAQDVWQVRDLRPEIEVRQERCVRQVW